MTSDSERPVPVRVAAVRELAGAWARGLDAMADEMYAYLARRIPEAAGQDEELAGLTLASCASNIEAILSMIRHGIPVAATEAPVAALEHARVMAQRGASIDATLRFYRLGHEHFWERWSATLATEIEDRNELGDALRQTASFIFDYIDIVSSRVSAEHIAERERLQRRAAVVRDDVVRAVLAGEAVDVAAAERALGHPLSRAQLAFVCWTVHDPAGLEGTAHAVAGALGATRALLVADGPQALAGWVVPQGRGVGDPDAVQAALAGGGDVLVAFGEVGVGREGFRRSREQADRARRIAELSGQHGPAVLRYGDVALVDLLSRDLDAARDFVAEQLAGLTGLDAATTGLRATLLAVLSPQGGVASAARELGLHRNTVLQRVRRAEALRGRPLDDGAADLHAALLLASTLGGAVLGDG